MAASSTFGAYGFSYNNCGYAEKITVSVWPEANFVEHREDSKDFNLI